MELRSGFETEDDNKETEYILFIHCDDKGDNT